MAVDRRPTHEARSSGSDRVQTDLDNAYRAAHLAFMDHVKDCYACRTRGIDCQAVGPIKVRLRETRSASIAGRTTAGTAR